MEDKKDATANSIITITTTTTSSGSAPEIADGKKPSILSKLKAAIEPPVVRREKEARERDRAMADEWECVTDPEDDTQTIKRKKRNHEDLSIDHARSIGIFNSAGLACLVRDLR